jgi:hypothetical protein
MKMIENESMPVAAMCLMGFEFTCSGFFADTKVHQWQDWVQKACKMNISPTSAVPNLPTGVRSIWAIPSQHCLQPTCLGLINTPQRSLKLSSPPACWAVLPSPPSALARRRRYNLTAPLAPQ